MNIFDCLIFISYFFQLGDQSLHQQIANVIIQYPSHLLGWIQYLQTYWMMFKQDLFGMYSFNEDIWLHMFILIAIVILLLSFFYYYIY